MQGVAAIPIPMLKKHMKIKKKKKKKKRERRDEKMRNEIITKYNPYWNLMYVLIVLFVYGAQALKLN